MNMLDIILLIPLAFGLYKGYKKGFILEVASLIALVFAIYAAVRFSEYASEILKNDYGFETQYLPLVSFVLVFLIVIVLVFAFAKLLERILKLTMLNMVNRIFGAIFCGLKYALILSVILMVISSINLQNKIISTELRTGSLLYEPVSKMSSTLVPALKSRIGYIKQELEKLQIEND
jgi:membrane protein required for colicin V production